VARPSRAPLPLRALLRLYPASFRDAYAAELAQCVRDARRALGASAPRGRVWRFWAAVGWDLTRGLAGERAGAALESVRRAPVRKLAGLSLLGAAGANVAYDVASVRDSMGILALLLTALTIVGGSTLLRGGPRPR
jgi:hypothetical protein